MRFKIKVTRSELAGDPDSILSQEAEIMASMDYENEDSRYDGECCDSLSFFNLFHLFLVSDLSPDEPRYDRDRSASPRPMKRDDNYRGGRDRSASPNGRMNSRSVEFFKMRILG